MATPRAFGCRARLINDLSVIGRPAIQDRLAIHAQFQSVDDVATRNGVGPNHLQQSSLNSAPAHLAALRG